jgi:DNA gyrase subunit A
MDILRYYVEYQRNVILRRSKFDLAQAKERCHILEGLIIAVQNIDEVVAIIKKAESTADAKQKLKVRFELSDRQAQAILDLRLAKLTKLEVYKLEQELAALRELIDKLTKIVNSNRLQLNVVKEEILQIRKKYARPRRSELAQDEKDIVIIRKDLKPPPTPCKVCIMADGALKCVSEKNYNMSSKEVTAKTKRNNLVVYRLDTMTDRVILAFTDLGNCYKLDLEDISCKLSEKGFALDDVVEEAEENERAVALFVENDENIAEILFITEKGMLKRTAWSEYSLNKKAYQAIRLNDGDKVIAVEPWVSDDGETVFFVTKQGICLNAQMGDIPAQGRVAGGVKGIMLGASDKVIFAKQINGEGEIVVVTKGGNGKRVICCMIDPSPRYRKGGKIVTFADKSDEVVYADYVTEPYYIAVESKEGFVSMETEDVPIDSNTAKGKKISKEPIKAVYSLR